MRDIIIVVVFTMIMFVLLWSLIIIGFHIENVAISGISALFGLVALLAYEIDKIKKKVNK
ncbi:MAG: hypothetical protein DRJ31_07885 [Candidatus Methanomethylicota archaeon]|uniref:Uncharacterized protein n=1 Tax=Thermoproteota archaeon TaxID=2056631 RepID=A0A497ELG3_9CREN|nr:MAG: hypothetical protein DRJ31_07885 [Candidatus Verstraetearchaeota archaeon]